MAGEDKFDPNAPFDAVADFVRKEIAQVALRAMEHGAYPALSRHDRIAAFVVGGMTGLIGCAFNSIEDAGRDAIVEYVSATIPFARQQAEEIIANGAPDGR